MESCSLGLYAQSPYSPSTTDRSNNAFPSASLKNVINTIRFFYDESGNCIQRSNTLNTNKHLDSEPHFRNDSILIKDNFATVTLRSSNDITVHLNIPPQNGGLVSVYSLSGILICSADIKSIETTLYINSQSASIYLVNITIDGITKNFKISKP